MSSSKVLGSWALAALCAALLFAVGANAPVEAQSVRRGGGFCATEGGRCAFSGDRYVRYGANDRYVVLLLSDGTDCTNLVFGDPAPNVRKDCFIEGPVSPTRPCADEGGRCSFVGPHYVFYGAGDHYVMLPMTNGAACTNVVFGDPAPGVRKACYIDVAPTRRGVLCANEDGRCSFTGARYVYYGAGDRFVVRLLTNGTACTNTVFGDPTPNIRKACYIDRSR